MNRLLTLIVAIILSLGPAACTSQAHSRESLTPAPAVENSPQPATSAQVPPPSKSQNTLPASSTAVPAQTRTPSPSATPSPTPSPEACWRQGGRYQQGSLRNELLPLPMEYSVYLPPCYDQQPDRRYPVLYMIHGQNYNHDQWDRIGIDEAADRLIAAGDIPPFLIVLPRDRSWAQPTEDPFGQVLAERLIPAIDEQYRTLPERAYRAVGGLSRGAGWAVHLGLSRWELFGAIGAHSLPVFWTDTYHIREWLDAIPPESLPRIYMDIGDKDRPAILQSAQWFEALLTEKGIPHVWYLFTGYHEEAYWAAHVEQYLRWYAEPWQEEKLQVEG